MWWKIILAISGKVHNILILVLFLNVLPSCLSSACSLCVGDFNKIYGGNNEWSKGSKILKLFECELSQHWDIHILDIINLS